MIENDFRSSDRMKEVNAILNMATRARLHSGICGIVAFMERGMRQKSEIRFSNLDMVKYHPCLA